MIESETGIVSAAQRLLCGFPPQKLDTTTPPDTLLKDLVSPIIASLASDCYRFLVDNSVIRMTRIRQGVSSGDMVTVEKVAAKKAQALVAAFSVGEKATYVPSGEVSKQCLFVWCALCINALSKGV